MNNEEVFLLESTFDVERLRLRFEELWEKIAEDSSSKIENAASLHESFYAPVEFPAIAQIVFAEIAVDLKGCRKTRWILIPTVSYVYLSDFSDLTNVLPFWQK